MRKPKLGIGVQIASAVAAFAFIAVMTTGTANAGVGMKCPGTFQVLHNDKINNLSIPAGKYTIKVKRMTCQSASDNFKNFLSAPGNKLPKGWRLFNGKMKFKSRTGGGAFRIKPYSGGGGGGGGGGGSMTGKCPGTFQVLHNDKINRLSVPAGAYQIRVKSMSCQSASSNFKNFLSAPGNKLPKGWKLIKPKQKFKSKSGGGSFRIKRVGN